MDNKNEMSKVMLRYIKNKDKYNTRAKEYFNKVYYPKHRTELLNKGKEERQKRQQSHSYIYKKDKTKCIEKVLNHSLIVSFD
jgi:hypothetical protein